MPEKTKAIRIGRVVVGGGHPLALIAGPCVIEGRKACLNLAGALADLSEREKIPLIFKASYDKANRTSHRSWRGPGIAAGLDILASVREKYGLPVVTDVHCVSEVPLAAEVADVLQIPAFLCRQTDLVMAAAKTGKPVNVKKGQFLAADDMKHVVAKIECAGGRKIMLTERGNSFGYHNLVVDMRNLAVLRSFGYPVVFDATHSVQTPGGRGGSSGGDSSAVPLLARAAVAAGCDVVFMETYFRPEKALSDGANAIEFARVKALWRTLRRLDAVVD